ncbi:MAG: NAD(P)H-hydrate epimerase, partial [Eubacteriaceae bacterium]
MKVVTPKQMAALDQKTIETGIPSTDLMEKAGEKATAEIKAVIPPHGRVLVLSGLGNNGGDGQVIARLLRQDQVDVSLLFPASEQDCQARFSPDSRINFSRLRDIPVIYAPPGSSDLIRTAVGQADVIVDALLGTGFDTTRPLREPMPELIQAVNDSKAIVIAVDIPSGLNGKSGQVGNQAIHADETIIIQAPKTGELLGDGPDCTGKPVIVDIGIHTDDPGIQTGLLEQELTGFPAVRKKNSHKYSYGRVLVVAGSKGMTGAAALASAGAVQSGAGLVTALVPEEIYQIEAVTMPREAMVKPYSDIILPENLSELQKDVILFG